VQCIELKVFSALFRYGELRPNVTAVSFSERHRHWLMANLNMVANKIVCVGNNIMALPKNRYYVSNILSLF